MMDYGFGTSYGGFFSLIIFVLMIIALVDLWRSHKEVPAKLLWSFLILFIPVLGIIIYAILGRDRQALTR